MPIKIISGRARAIRDYIARWRKSAENDKASAAMIVPAQLTLQAERDFLETLDINGSFNIQVYSPQRLFKRIFELAGEPGKARIDEQGRVMLTHLASLKCENDLKWYSKAVGKPGFAGKLVQQIVSFKQAGLKPGDILEMSRDAGEATSKKLEDLSLLYQSYENLIEGRFMDGEDEIIEAVKRIGEAGFLNGCRVCVYGFDILTPTLDKLIVGLCDRAQSVDVNMVNDDNPDSRDYHTFEPVNRSINMLLRLAALNGVRCETESLQEPLRSNQSGLGILEKEMFSVPPMRYMGLVKDVQMAVLPNPEAEAEFAVSIIRRMCRLRGWRYKDFAIALVNNDEYSRDALNRAFTRARTPLFLANGRPADRHCLSRALLSALRAAGRGYRLNDMVGYLRSGFSGLEDDECDELINYAVSTNMRGGRWVRPIDDDALEELRKRTVKPICDMADNVDSATDARGKIAAVFTFLEDIDAYSRLKRASDALRNLSMPVWAMEGEQVWNRIIAALDQMYELMKDEKISVALLYDCLSRALGQTNVKALPQSADAVEAGALEHLRGKPVKALIVLGDVETSFGVSGGLLDENEIARLTRSNEGFMALSRRDMTRMQKLNILSLIALTDKYMLVTRPLSDTAGRAIPAGGLMRSISGVLPKVPVRGIEDAEKLMSACFEQGDIALARLPNALKTGVYGAGEVKEALGSIEMYGDRLNRVMSAKNFKVYSEKLPSNLVKPAYGALDSVSVSRLERFASCPFKHFVSYALKPAEFRIFELSPRDAGIFYHEALEAFMKEYAPSLGEMTVEQSRASMDEITGRLIDTALNSAFEPGEIEKAEAGKMRNVARRAADIITRQFDGSRFIPVDIEADLSSGKARVALDEAELIGRVDRVDVFEADNERYVRVVDYKRGSKRVSLPEIYEGLQLQLIMYLASAVKRFGGKPAGMFYFSVSDPLIDTTVRDPEAVQEARSKMLRLDGLALNDARVIRAMANEPDMAIKVSFNKDGSIRKSANVLENDDFETLIQRSIEMAKIIIRDIKNGDTDISPVKTSLGTACDYCEYKTMCQFDDRIDGANTRDIELTKGADVLDAIRRADGD